MAITLEKKNANLKQRVSWNDQFKKKLYDKFVIDGKFDWLKFGEKALTLLKRTPTTQFMYLPQPRKCNNIL